jgi:hypothetical protein
LRQVSLDTREVGGGLVVLFPMLSLVLGDFIELGVG